MRSLFMPDNCPERPISDADFSDLDKHPFSTLGSERNRGTALTNPHLAPCAPELSNH